jgi:Membrane domain of glycerophosphoryl diester phosphodiesterase
VPTVAGRLDPRLVFRQTFGMYRRHARVLVPVALVAVGVPAAVEALATSRLNELVASLVNTVVATSATAVFAGTAKEVARRVHEGEPPPSITDLARAVRHVFFVLAAIGVIEGIGWAVGLLLLVVPGLYLMTRWAVAAAVVTVEHTSVRAAFRRSHELVRGSAWRVFVVLVLVLALSAVLGAVIEGAIELAGGHADVSFGVMLEEVIALPIEGLAIPVMYYALAGLETARRSGPIPQVASAP